MTRFIPHNDWLSADGITLTSEQFDVVRAIDKNIAIIAGPGTGKTEVLAQKATYLLQTRICRAPFRILTLCYTIDAAANIRERVQQRCPSDLAHRFQSMTSDSFIISLVRRFAASLPDWLKIERDFEIQSFSHKEKTKLDVLIENVDDETKNLYLDAAMNNCFNYDMCRKMAYYIVRNNTNIRISLSNTYKYIFLDEFQDMTDSHYETLKLLFCNDYNKVSAVGDYNQAIMSFAGATPDIFNKFKTDFKAKEYQFRYNHRSSSEIVLFINTIVKILSPVNYTRITYLSNKPADSTSLISAHYFNSVSEEASHIAQCITNIKTENPTLSLGDFAIILKQKTEDYLKNTKSTFSKHNISVRNEAEKVCKDGVQFQDLMVDKLSKLTIYFLKSKLGIITPAEQKELHDLLSRILSLNLNRQQDIRKLHETKRKIIKNEFIKTKTWVGNIFTIIPCNKICNKLYPNKKSFQESAKSISDLLEKCVDSTTDLPSAIDEYMGVNSVRLMTIHKSKGLEFDTVFFADFRTSSWWTLTDQKEESLRCFFVGLSRAKKRLFFTSPTKEYPPEIESMLKTVQWNKI